MQLENGVLVEFSQNLIHSNLFSHALPLIYTLKRKCKDTHVLNKAFIFVMCQVCTILTI